MTIANSAPRATESQAASDPFQVRQSIISALTQAPAYDAPYRHWLVGDIFAPEAIMALRALPRRPVDLHGVSGKRELHNDQRHYFDQAAIGEHPICAAVAASFQHPDVVAAFEDKTGAKL